MLSVGAVQILIMLLGLIRSKFLSVSLGPAGLGLVGTIDQLALALVSLGALGLPFAALKWMARSHSESNEKFHRTYAGFLWALAILGLLTGLIGAALASFLPQVFGHELARYHLLIAIAMLGIPAFILNILVVNALAASQKGRRSALYNLLVQALLLASTVSGVYAGGLRGLYVATVSVGVSTTVAAIVLLRHALGTPNRSDAAWLLDEMKRNPTVVSYSIWVYAAGAVYALVMSGLRTLVFSHYGAATAGLLQASLSLALTVGAVITPMSNLLLTPLVNRSISAREKVSAANQFAGRILTILVVVSLPLLLFPRLAMSLLFAHGFLPAAGFLFVFVIWQSVAQVVNVYTQLLIGLDDVAFACAWICVSYGVVVLLAPPLMSRLGLPGAGFALMTGAVIGGIGTVVRLARKFGASADRRVLLRTGVAVVSMVAAAVASAVAPEDLRLGLGIRVIVAAVAIGLQWKLLDPADVVWARARLSRARLV